MVSRFGPDARALFPALLLALGLIGTSTMPVMGGGETGTVVFRVTLQGPVPSGDAFSVYRVADPAQWVDSSRGICNPPDWSSDPRAQQPTCTATTYETSVSGAVGARVDYSLLRDPAGDPVLFEEHQAGSLTIEPGQQVVNLKYTYPTASPASGGTAGSETAGATGQPPASSSGDEPVLLPDTAVPRPTVGD